MEASIGVSKKVAETVKHLADAKGITEEKVLEFLLSFYDNNQYLDPEAVQANYALRLKKIDRSKKVNILWS